MSEPDVHIQRVQMSDRTELLSANTASHALHAPWIAPPLTPQTFKLYLRRIDREDHEGFLVRDRQTNHIVGVVNINNIVRGSFLSASLGYYASAAFAGRGYMAQGVRLVRDLAFEELGLHRLEANIQPDNKPSKSLIQRCGFEKEGISRAFLFINGAWRDHERWCAVDPRTTLTK